MKRYGVMGLLLGLMGCCLFSVAEDMKGEIKAVIKGDFIKVVSANQEPVVYRLYGIDSPEKGQPFGKEAQDFAAKLAVGHQVVINDTGKKVDGIPEVVVTLDNGKTLNQEIVSNGFAWWDNTDAPDDTNLRTAFTKAQQDKKGLWADPSPVAPWEFRHDPNHPQSFRMDEPVFVTKKDFIYHRATCKLLLGEKTKITRGKAQEIGYYPCPECFPETKVKHSEIKFKGDFDKEPPKAATPSKATASTAGNTPPKESSQSADAKAESNQDISPEELIIKHAPSFPTDSKGNVLGLTANNIADIPYAAKLGFQNGDILSEVNGVAVTGPDKAYQIYDQVKGARSLNVKVIRNGSPININVSIPH